MKVAVIAYIPDDLVNAWFQHIRDFDITYHDCHFEILADTPNMTLAEMVEQVKIHPELTFMDIIERKKKLP